MEQGMVGEENEKETQSEGKEKEDRLTPSHDDRLKESILVDDLESTQSEETQRGDEERVDCGEEGETGIGRPESGWVEKGDANED